MWDLQKYLIVCYFYRNNLEYKIFKICVLLISSRLWLFSFKQKAVAKIIIDNYYILFALLVFIINNISKFNLIFYAVMVVYKNNKKYDILVCFMQYNVKPTRRFGIIPTKSTYCERLIFTLRHRPIVSRGTLKSKRALGLFLNWIEYIFLEI